MTTKKDLRQKMRSELSAQKPEDRARRSLKIHQKLFSFAPFQKARLVLFYVSLAEEVDTAPMIQKTLESGKRVAVPRAALKTKKLSVHEIRGLSGELKPGILGIPEPDPTATREIGPDEIDLVVVPGLAFDPKNRRLGRGAGFYDRFLGTLSGHTSKVGLAFSFQIVPEVPCEAHDVALDAVLTDQ